MRRELLAVTCLLMLLCASCVGSPFEEDNPSALRGVNLWPIYRSQSVPSEGLSRTEILWPIGYQRQVDTREGRSRTKVLWPIGYQRTADRDSGESVTHILWPFFAKWTQPGRSTTYFLQLGHFAYGALLSIARQAPSGTDIHIIDLFGQPLFRIHRSALESDISFFPLLRHSSRRIAGLREYEGWILWPLIGWKRQADVSSFKALPFYWSRTSAFGEKKLTFAFPFWYSRSPARTVFNIVPFFWKKRVYDETGHHESTKLPPFYFYRRERNAQRDVSRRLVIPLFGVTRDHRNLAQSQWSPVHYYAVRRTPGDYGRSLSILWLFWRHVNPTGGATKLIPFFFSKKDARGRHVIIPPFYWDSESYLTGERTVFAFPYFHRRTARTEPDARESTSFLWPAYTSTKWLDGTVGRQILGLFWYKSSPTGMRKNWWAGPVYARRDGDDTSHGVVGIYGRRRVGLYRGLNLLWGRPPYRPGDRSHFGILWRLVESRKFAGGSRFSLLYDLIMSRTAPGEREFAFRPFYRSRRTYVDRSFSILGIYSQTRSRYRKTSKLFGFEWSD